MTKTNNITRIIILISIFSIPLTLSKAEELTHAKIPATETAKETMPVIKNLTDSLDFLNIIKERELPINPIALQTVINRILDLLNAQNEGMLSDLNAVQDIIPPDYENRAGNYRAQLSAIRLRNENIRGKINQDISAQEIITRGKELRTSHATIEPMLNKILDFTSVFTNQNAIMKTVNRLAAIMKDEKKIRITLSDAKWGTFTQLIKYTQALIKNAKQLNKKAVELLADQDAPEPEEGITIESLITQSENNIKAAYTNFLGMSKLIKK